MKHPFHVYSMRQAIAEGFILDVLAGYTTYAVYYKLANAHPQRPGAGVQQGSRGAGAVCLAAPLHARRQGRGHRRALPAEGGPKIDGQAKAMVVTRSRLHPVRTKQAIDAYIAKKGYDRVDRPLRALVAFSGTVVDPDAPEVALIEASMNRLLDKLSALISAMNEKYGADLGETDKVWVDQQWTVVKGDDEMRTVAENNDRSHYELVLQQKIKDLLVDRREKNGVLFDMFFANPDFQSGLMAYLAGAYDEFRREATV